jgi:hypothetical protein
MCAEICEDFCVMFPQLQGSSLNLLGHRHPYLNRADDLMGYPNPDPNYHHVMCAFPDNIVVDLTCRQFDTKSERYYAVQTLDVVIQEWFMLATSWDVLDTFLDCRTVMGKIKAGDTTVGQQAVTYYTTLSTAISSGNLAFSGSAADNPHLDALLNIWPKYLSVG